MGEAQKRPFQLSFNSSPRVEFQGARAGRTSGPERASATTGCLVDYVEPESRVQNGNPD